MVQFDQLKWVCIAGYCIHFSFKKTQCMVVQLYRQPNLIILEWTTSLNTSSRTLFVREDVSPDVHVTSNVEIRNNVRLLLNVELRNITSDC